jgi:hypothetical protein
MLLVKATEQRSTKGGRRGSGERMTLDDTEWLLSQILR